MNRKITTFEMNGDEVGKFEKAFESSGFRSKSEFIRWVLFQGIEDLYGVNNDT